MEKPDAPFFGGFRLSTFRMVMSTSDPGRAMEQLWDPKMPTVQFGQMARAASLTILSNSVTASASSCATHARSVPCIIYSDAVREACYKPVQFEQTNYFELPLPSSPSSVRLFAQKPQSPYEAEIASAAACQPPAAWLVQAALVQAASVSQGSGQAAHGCVTAEVPCRSVPPVQAKALADQVAAGV